MYDEAVTEGLVVLWEASDRLCGKRLKALLPILVPGLERHGHLCLDPRVREQLMAVSAATIVRRLVGYGRLEGVAAGEVLARLYSAARLFVNVFQPSFKLAEKTRIGARVHKRYTRRRLRVRGCLRRTRFPPR